MQTLNRVTEPVLLFDGVCNLCNGTVDFLMRRDHRQVLRFASLQSDAAHQLLQKAGGTAATLDSVVLVHEGQVHLRSTAVLRTLRLLGLPWALAYALIVVPRPLRDAAYRLIARNRYRWFGRHDTCRIPTPEERARFL